MRISDWSSDVCSSDLDVQDYRFRHDPHGSMPAPPAGGRSAHVRRLPRRPSHPIRFLPFSFIPLPLSHRTPPNCQGYAEIGRASCRERVCQYVKIAVVGGPLKKNKNTMKEKI